MLTPIQFIELVTLFVLILYTGIAVYYAVRLGESAFETTLQFLGSMFVITLFVAGILICLLTIH